MIEGDPSFQPSDPLLERFGNGYTDVNLACSRWLLERGMQFDNPTEELWYRRTAEANRLRHEEARARR